MLKKMILFGLILVGAFIMLILYFQTLRVIDFTMQSRRISSLTEAYKTMDILDEHAFVGAQSTESLRLNEMRFIASHNSYKKYVPWFGYIAIGLGEDFDEANSLRYQTNTLTEQLFDGIRSFELDVRYKNGAYEVVHVPLVDHRSHAIDFALALEEIRIFSENNPNHLPITLLLEIKDDWMILDPWLDDYDAEAFDVLDEIIIDQLKNHLLMPNAMLENHDTLSTTISEDGWPLIDDLRGKILVVKHPSKYTQMYVDRDQTLQTLAMFPGVYSGGADAHYASFVVHNSPEVDVINALVKQGLIVRTRADSTLKIDSDRRTRAFESGAQIITTDFYPNHQINPSYYVVVFEHGYTMIENHIKPIMIEEND